MANLNELTTYRTSSVELDIAWNQPINVVTSESDLLELLARNQEIFSTANQEIRSLNNRVRQLEGNNQELDEIIQDGIQTVNNLHGRIAELEDELLERAENINALAGQIRAAQSEQDIEEEGNVEESQQLRERIQGLEHDHDNAIERMSQVLLSILGREVNADTSAQLNERISNIAQIIGQDRAEQIRDAVTAAIAGSERQTAERVQQDQARNAELGAIREQITNVGARFENFVAERTRVLVEEATRDCAKLADLVNFLRNLNNEIYRQRNSHRVIRNQFENMNNVLKQFNGHNYTLPASFESVDNLLRNKNTQLANLIQQIDARMASLNENIHSDHFNELQCQLDIYNSRELASNVNRTHERTIQQEFLAILNTNLDDATSNVSWLQVTVIGAFSGLFALTGLMAPLFVMYVDSMNTYGKQLDIMKELINNEIDQVNQFIRNTFTETVV